MEICLSFTLPPKVTESGQSGKVLTAKSLAATSAKRQELFSVNTKCAGGDLAVPRTVNNFAA
jgi:hypothetical protein